MKILIAVAAACSCLILSGPAGAETLRAKNGIRNALAVTIANAGHWHFENSMSLSLISIPDAKGHMDFHAVGDDLDLIADAMKTVISNLGTLPLEEQTRDLPTLAEFFNTLSPEEKLACLARAARDVEIETQRNARAALGAFTADPNDPELGLKSSHLKKYLKRSKFLDKELQERLREEIKKADKILEERRAVLNAHLLSLPGRIQQGEFAHGPFSFSGAQIVALDVSPLPLETSLSYAYRDRIRDLRKPPQGYPTRRQALDLRAALGPDALANLGKDRTEELQAKLDVLLGEIDVALKTNTALQRARASFRLNGRLDGNDIHAVMQEYESILKRLPSMPLHSRAYWIAWMHGGEENGLPDRAGLIEMHGATLKRRKLATALSAIPLVAGFAPEFISALHLPARFDVPFFFAMLLLSVGLGLFFTIRLLIFGYYKERFYKLMTQLGLKGELMSDRQPR